MKELKQPMRRHHFLPLDGLRGIAILLVILVHSFQYNGNNLVGQFLEVIARTGWVGVILFFVLSGFLISGILFDTKGHDNYLRDFYARRSLRIFPLYFAFLALYFLVVPHIPLFADRLQQPDPADRIYYLTYTANFLDWYADDNKPAIQPLEPLGPLWSLAVEEQVYLFWPFIILFVPRRRLSLVFVCIALISIAWRCGALYLRQPLNLTTYVAYAATPGNMEAFALGAIVALWSRDHRDRLIKIAPYVTIGSMCFLVGLLGGLRHFDFWQSPVMVLCLGVSSWILFFSSVIALSITRDERFIINRLLSIRILRSFGQFSYAIYVFHESIITLLAPLVFSNNTQLSSNSVTKSLVFTLLVIGCSYLVAMISWYTFETWFLKLKSYFPLSSTVAR